MLKIIILLVIMMNHLQASEKHEYLGTLAGDIRYVLSTLNPTIATYARNYMGIDLYRKKLEEEGDKALSCEGYKTYGMDAAHHDGVFFRVVKTYQDEDKARFLNCFQYALGTYGHKLEEIAGKSIEAIQDSVSTSIDDAVRSYFEPIADEPQDGDLVIYQTTKQEIKNTSKVSNYIIDSGTNTHGGIYRKSKPLERSAHGGTVESKMGFFACHYVFRHDVFFVPSFCGDLAKFYRLKTK